MKYCGVTVQVKATEQYFPVVLFIMLYKVVLTCKCVDKILWCDVGVTTKMKATEQYFLAVIYQTSDAVFHHQMKHREES